MKSEVAQQAILLTIIGMAAVNFAIRFTPIAILSRVELPRPVLRWLSFIPVAVMGSLVASEVLTPHGVWQPPLTNPGVYASILSALTFRFTRSFLGATLAGMVSYVALRAVL